MRMKARKAEWGLGGGGGVPEEYMCECACVRGLGPVTQSGLGAGQGTILAPLCPPCLRSWCPRVCLLCP